MQSLGHEAGAGGDDSVGYAGFGYVPGAGNLFWMHAFAVRSPAMTLALILLSIAVVGISLSVLGVGANMIAGFTSIASVLVAALGIVSAPWLASRSGPGALACGAVALGVEVVAALLLLTSPPSNSHFWVPINLGRFGGVIVAELGLALTLHAAILRRLGPRRAVALVSANVLAVAIGVAIADWETRRLTFLTSTS